MSKKWASPPISPIAARRIFDAVGLRTEFVGKYFTGTATRIEGVGVEPDCRGGGCARHRMAIRRCADLPLDARWSAATTRCAVRGRGPRPGTRRRLATLASNAVRGNSYEKYRQYAELINRPVPRQLFTIRGPVSGSRPRIEDGRPCWSRPTRFEPAVEIVKRFSTGRHVLRLDPHARRTPRSPSP